jgi:hypothetical protein
MMNAAIVLLGLVVVTLVVALIFIPERSPELMTVIPPAVRSPTVPTVDERLILRALGTVVP